MIMVEHFNQPRENDAVLGSSYCAPLGAVILGGIAGVKRRLASDDETVKIAALKDALKYGESGLGLIIPALQDESAKVQRVAYLLLRDRTEREAKRALNAYLPYHLFEDITTHKAGQSIAISPDGTRITYLRGKTIRVYHIETQEILYKIPKYPKAKEFLALTDDVKIVVRVSNGASHVIEIWDQGELRHSLYGHQDVIRAIAICPDGRIIASGSQDTTIKLWHLETGKLICTFSNQLTLGAHTDEIWSLAFSADGNTLVSSSRDGKIKLWDWRTRDRPRTLKSYANQVAMNPDGLTLASTNWQGQIQLWNLATHQVEHTLEGYYYAVNSLLFSRYGRILISGGNDGGIKFWDVATGKQIQTLTGHKEAVTCLTFCRDGQYLVSGSLDKTIKIWGCINNEII
ncbi:WD40 repeat domain-containing protein [Coleofasciculus chthonoplastes]|uniref:WD40 repeat domain-containing protein n=2 Tax=Coleofasciculus chthonoplastes TaxID=64178 RepID=UPI0040640949